MNVPPGADEQPAAPVPPGPAGPPAPPPSPVPSAPQAATAPPPPAPPGGGTDGGLFAAPDSLPASWTPHPQVAPGPHVATRPHAQAPHPAVPPPYAPTPTPGGPTDPLVGYAQTHLADGWSPSSLRTLDAPAARHPRERLATPALVLAFLVAPVGVVLGLVAARRARRDQRSGLGTALAAVAVGLAVCVALPSVALPSSAGWARLRGATDPLPTITAETRAHVRQLEVGHCLRDELDDTVRRVTVVPCTDAHAGEVVASVPLRATSWPGTAEATRLVSTTCRLTSHDGARTIALAPTAAGWRAGDRTGLCVAEGFGTG